LMLFLWLPKPLAIGLRAHRISLILSGGLMGLLRTSLFARLRYTGGPNDVHSSFVVLKNGSHIQSPVMLEHLNC
jgi:hypothetical protein